MRLLEKLKSRYGVGAWGVVAILVTFALAGMSVVRIREPVMSFLLPEDAPAWMHWVLYPIVVFPIYQALLLGYGFVLGKFSFFWNKEKALARWLVQKLRT